MEKYNKQRRRSKRILQKEDEQELKVEIKQNDAAILMLKQFDLTMKYGPFIGINRISRWKRACELNLNPPIKIKEYLENTFPLYERDIWYEF